MVIVAITTNQVSTQLESGVNCAQFGFGATSDLPIRIMRQILRSAAAVALGGPKRPASSLPAANGMVCASCGDGGDPCSVRGTQSHAKLAMRALCRLEGVRHRNFITNLKSCRVLGIKRVLSSNCAFHGTKQECRTMSQKNNF